jgi:phage shock protein A
MDEDDAKTTRDLLQRITTLEVLTAERQKQNEELKTAVMALTANVATLNNIITEAKGGRKVVVVLLSLAASIGGAVAYAASHLRWSG